MERKYSLLYLLLVIPDKHNNQSFKIIHSIAIKISQWVFRGFKEFFHVQ